MSAPSLEVSVGKVRLKNPLIAASGTFGYGLEFEHLLDLNQIGGFVTKGLSLKPRAGNPAPRIHETSSGMLNSIGLHNIGVEDFLENKLPRLQKYSTAVIANIYGETPDEFVEVARRLHGASGLTALEINCSCPNVKKGGLDLGTNPDSVYELVSRIRAVTDFPLWAKLTPNVTDIKALADAAIRGGVDALCLINSLRGMALDWRKRTPHLYTYTGGLTGPAIKPVALARVFEVASHFSIPIIGIGGIACGEDVLEFMVAGAQAVQIGTQNFVRTDAMITILQETSDLLRQEKISDIQTLVGSIKKVGQSLV